MNKLAKKYHTSSLTLQSPKSFLAAILFVVYSFSVFQFDFLHGFIHQEINANLHTQQAEKDNCHRSIYHSSKANCQHKTHINQSKAKCSLCDSHFSREHLAFSFSTFSFNKVAAATPVFYCISPLLDTPQNGHSRAPPFVV